MFGLSVPQAAATLAAALIGYQIRLFDEAVLNGAILMILVTCTIGPWVVEKYGRRVALREKRQPYRPSEAPQRILLAVSKPATAEPLMDFALLLREAASPEPLYPLMVVPGRGEGEEDASRVAAAEKLLSRMVLHAASAEAPVTPLTRVDFNFARGIGRAIAETRSTTVVVGWERRRSRRFALSGSVMDQLIQRTPQLVLVARVKPPLNTIRRVIVVLPPCSDRSRGFCDAVRALKVMTNRLGAELLGLVVEGNCTDYAAIIEEIEPAVPVALEEVGGWGSLLPMLRERVGVDDIVVVVSARRGTLAWSRELDRVPAALQEQLPGSMVVAYPSEVESPAREDAGTLVPEELVPDQVVLDIPQVPLQKALEQLLGDMPDLNGTREKVAAGLARQEMESPTEVTPGVAVPNARVKGLSRPRVLLGISRDGIEFPGAEMPAHIIFVLLSPLEDREGHLRRLGKLARLIRDSEQLRNLLRSQHVESVLEGFRTDGARLERA